MEAKSSRINFKIDDRQSWFELENQNTVEDVIQGLKKCEKGSDKEFIATLNNDSELEIRRLTKQDFFSGKDELSKLKHPYFSKLGNLETVKEKQELTFDKNENILVFSPHPDDEILGACALLRSCIKSEIKIKVIYMTSGKSQGGANIRQIEATRGVKILGGNEENIQFCEMPFYPKKNREVTDEDHDYVRKIIHENNPTSVFICSDVFDPNATHWRCYDVLMKIFEDEAFSNINRYFYYSVWYWPADAEYTHILPYDFEVYKLKIYAMLEHQSQLENDFMGNDPRPFYQRATTRDKQFGKQHNSAFCEVFYKLN
jgi:LmbE family N-acetylglucosaminyl deacetylase